jgi:hypothetical protein
MRKTTYEQLKRRGAEAEMEFALAELKKLQRILAGASSL